MTYSCTDFVDDILNKLRIDVPPEAQDEPAAQCALALARIDDLLDKPPAGDGAVFDLMTQRLILDAMPSRTTSLQTVYAAQAIARARFAAVVVEEYDTGESFIVTRFGLCCDAPAWWRQHRAAPVAAEETAP